MKTPELLEQEQNFFDYIKNYTYINHEGRLDLERFCCDLSLCLHLDDIPYSPPKPRDIYNLLIECLNEFEDCNTAGNWVQHQRISDWKPEHGSVYPDKFRTYIHIAGLIHTHSLWIYCIGHELIGIPEPETSNKYYGWVDEDWAFSYTFIDGWHNCFFDFIKKVDRDKLTQYGYSMLEALHKATNEDIDYSEALTSLMERHIHHEEGIQRIKTAIAEGFYLEAVTLEECIISNYLNSFLKAKKINLNNPTFATLLGKIRSGNLLKDERLIALFNEINQWRKQRNLAIHGFVTAREPGSDNSLASFISFAQNTSEMGISYVEQVKEWYNDACVEYVEHRFPSKGTRKTS